MDIILNGERRTIPDGITVFGLFEFLKIQHQRVAVELNREIVKKDMYGSTAIKEGDSLEVVSFMQGGGQVRSADHSTVAHDGEHESNQFGVWSKIH